MRRPLLASLRLMFVLAAMVPMVGRATAQTYPTRPVTLVVPFPAGSTTDLVGRILADRLSAVLGQQVVVDDKSGAGGSVGSEYVARSTPDGYTLLMGTIGTHAINPSERKSLIAQGLDPVNGSPDDLSALTRSELARWAKVVEMSGARLQN
jgi:tripartite-type tricarboxylate transporter receptor subunit TctC